MCRAETTFAPEKEKKKNPKGESICREEGLRGGEREVPEKCMQGPSCRVCKDSGKEQVTLKQVISHGPRGQK